MGCHCLPLHVSRMLSKYELVFADVLEVHAGLYQVFLKSSCSLNRKHFRSGGDKQLQMAFEADGIFSSQLINTSAPLAVAKHIPFSLRGTLSQLWQRLTCAMSSSLTSTKYIFACVGCMRTFG